MMSTLVPGGGSKATGRNAELSLHIFKRQTGSPEVELYTIGVWEGTHQRAICHDACLDCALRGTSNAALTRNTLHGVRITLVRNVHWQAPWRGFGRAPTVSSNEPCVSLFLARIC